MRIQATSILKGLVKKIEKLTKKTFPENAYESGSFIKI